MSHGILHGLRHGFVHAVKHGGLTLGGDAIMWVIGDSNIFGQGNANNVGSVLEFGAGGATFAPVTLASQQAANVNDPPPFGAEIGPESLQAFAPGVGQGYGPEITLGRQANAINSTFGYEVKCGIVASLLETHWLPGAAYGASLSGGNLYRNQRARVQAYAAQTGREVKVIFVNLGTNDASSSGPANNTTANMTTMVNQLHADFPSAVIVWPLVHVSTVQTFTTTVRTQQTTYAATAPAFFKLINIDHIKLQDPFHWDNDGILIVGQLVAFAAGDLLGIPRATVSAPTIVGVGVAQSGSALTQSPIAWPGTTQNDTELLICVGNGTVAGTISTPAGWTLATNGVITAVGFTTTWKIFSRARASGETETSNTPVAVTVTFTNSTDNLAKRLTIRGPNPHPTVDVSNSTQPNAFSTGPMAVAALTATQANSLVIHIVGGGVASIPATATVTAGGLTNFAKVAETYFAFPSADSVLYSIWAGNCNAGTTGTASASFSVNTLEFGSAVVIKP